ncbi:MAG: hypothetical protein EAX95_00980 [Candidatus Thorarchaeota archaeon]|nr:hypothetical protein [Candidatus Thorarchaeota archaeon]
MSKRTTLRYLHIALMVIIVASTLFQAVTGGSLDVFLPTSLLLVVYSVINLLYCHVNSQDARIGSWRYYATLLLIAMIFGSIGDFAMPGLLLFPTTTALINGIIFFGIGHLFYLLALRNRSPLFFEKKETRRIRMNNAIIWILSIVAVIVLFQLTIYNPADQVMSIGALGYGILLVTALAFAMTKWFDEYPVPFKLALVFGFLFFFISDWAIAFRYFQDPSFMSGTAFVGVTYLIGQLLLQSSTLLGFQKPLHD